MRRVVSAIANSVMNTAPARLANSLSSARWKIMRYFRPVEFSIKTLSPESGEKRAAWWSACTQGERAHRRRAKRVDQASQGRAEEGARATSPARPARRCCCARCPAWRPSACCWSAWASASEFAETAYRDAVRGAASALKELGAKDAALFLVDMKVGSRAGELERAPGGARRARGLLPLRPAEDAEEAAGARARACRAAARLRSAQLEQALAEAQSRPPTARRSRARSATCRRNICTPTYLADEAKKLAREFKLEVEVLERKDMEKLGMGAFLAVAQRARTSRPSSSCCSYNGARRKEREAAGRLVGKGITFDTGGISLKPAGEMDEMKFDMSGAGSGARHAARARRHEARR